MRNYRFRYYPKGPSRSRVMRSRMSFSRRYGRRRSRMSRMMSRRIRPELKFRLQSNGANGIEIPAATRYTTNVTPAVWTQGAGQGQRVGSAMKTLRCSIRYVLDAINAISINGDVQIRVVFWSPRIGYPLAEAYVNDAAFLEPLDYNVVTVHYDQYVSLGQNQLVTDTAGTNFVVSRGSIDSRTKKAYFKWPRKITFRGNDTAVKDDEQMYCMIYNPHLNTAIRFTYTARVSYVDS